MIDNHLSLRLSDGIHYTDTQKLNDTSPQHLITKIKEGYQNLLVGWKTIKPILYAGLQDTLSNDQYIGNYIIIFLNNPF